MYILPSTTINLYKDVPLDSKYEQSIVFENEIEQRQFFASKLFPLSSGDYSSFSGNTFQRVDKGVFRIRGNAMEYIGVNYASFQNHRIVNGRTYSKMYYAFIDKVEYHNENASTFYYTIDVLQTWQFDWELTDCMVVRQHTVSDLIGEHTISEGFDVGDLIIEHQEKLYKKDKCVITATKGIDTTRAKWENVQDAQIGNTRIITKYPFYEEYLHRQIEHNFQDRKTNNTPNPFYTYCVPLNGEAARSLKIGDTYYAAPVSEEEFNEGVSVITPISARSILEAIEYHGFSDALINVQIAPNEITPTIEETRDMVHHSSNDEVETITADFRPTLNPRNYKTKYGIKNNKMMSYPFFQYVMRAGSNNYTYKPELFDDNVSFTAWCVIYPTVEAAIAPNNYSGVVGCNDEFTLIRNDFMEIAAEQNTYTTWWNRNNTKVALGMVSSALTTSANVATAGAFGGLQSGVKSGIGGGASLINTSLGYLGDITYYSKLPDKMVGGLGNGNVTRQGVTNDDYTFTFEVVRPKAELIRIFDDFFTRYGYSIRRTTTPNIKARPHYTFIQTSGSDIQGVIPADDKKKINDIFDRGVTFWRDYENFGDFTVDNTP